MILPTDTFYYVGENRIQFNARTNSHFDTPQHEAYLRKLDEIHALAVAMQRGTHDAA